MTELRFCKYMVGLSAAMIVFNLVTGVARVFQESWTSAAMHAFGGLIMTCSLDQAIKNKRRAERRVGAK